MIRIARREDINQIMAIVQETIEDLSKEGNVQWSDEYPMEEHFLNDISNNQLYIFETGDRVAGFICINTDEDVAYQGVNWRKNEPAIIIHRFAVKRDNQNGGIGTRLLEYAFRFARNKGLSYVKVDTNSKNSRMNRLFQKMGFELVGQIQLRNISDLFNCYDKILEVE